MENTAFSNVDKNITPDKTGVFGLSRSVFVGLLFGLMGVVMLCVGVRIHFNTYESKYLSVKATITDINCERYIINRDRDDYHCTMTVQYVVNDRILSTTIQTESEDRYYIGSEIELYVDKYNPVKVDTPYISADFLALAMCLCGVLTILTTVGCFVLKV
ncbi:hypothetical protein YASMINEVIRUS_292 [Yasminevirus sp. GU-2018]|uniref:Uncharacterized protein n=1 Tax=Yasminevirus sp. GU-2018 TaxID=2420051 RepID=A0A5K0U7A3_9VIRU|nr:hypothetical protein YASMINEVIRUS_292 [Yasminevirus sp. GU-2018]